ncbi:transglutaminase family protein [Paenibacillus sp. y28]|uniref:transglutaminase family protein n=1 Tax=Paenibacillus sp. y28 TaxID=3129110 RepID=UPI003018CF92
MKLEICHVTHYNYADMVSDSVNEVRLSPRTNYRQACYHQHVVTEPAASLFTYEDFFGNRVHSFTVNKMHKQLKITTTSTVVTHENDNLRREVLSPEEEWRWVRSEKFQDQVAEFLLPTRYVRITEEVMSFADRLGTDEQGVFGIVNRMMEEIRSEFAYQPKSTNVHSTVEELFRLKQGVCQDFTHLMLALCRFKGIPARYVSGYHFVGDLNSRMAHFEQASHAWVEAYIPGTGWLGFDPTNNCQVGGRHVKLGHGRDYHDIVPVKGVYRGTPEQSLHVLVDVRKIG